MQTPTSCCPLSLLPVIERPEWQDLEAGPNYRVSFRCYGRHIISTRPSGDCRHADVLALYRHRDRIIDSIQDGAGLPYVEIRDYHDMHGIPCRRARTEQRDCMLLAADRCQAWLAIHAPPVVRQIFRVGLLLTAAPYPIEFSPGIEHALQRALFLLEAAGVDTAADSLPLFDAAPVLSQMDADGFQAEMRMVNPHVFFCRYRGTLIEDHVEAAKRCYADGLTAAIANGLETTRFCKVSDYRHSDGNWYTRTRSASALKEIHTNLQAVPKRSIMVAPSESVRITAKLISPFLSYEVSTVPDLAAAVRSLRQIRDPGKPDDVGKPQPILPHHVRDVLACIGSLTMEEHIPENMTIPEQHPLADIFRMLQLFQYDIRSMMHDNATQLSIIEAQNRQLRKEIAKRTETEQSLRQAMQEAEAANQAKGRFLANMSHEIRTPLNGILGTSELLQGTPLNDEQAEYCHIIQQSGRGLHGIIDDILDFSKIDSGKMELAQRPLSLQRLAEDVHGLFLHQAMQRGIDLALAIDPGLPSAVIGDQQRLRQVLINLISNAIKFTSAGSVTIRMRTEPLPHARALVCCAVSDTGIGIPDERLPDLFQAFSQIDDSRRRPYGGTGLGLAICKQLVQLMGGSISVDSAADRGSCFEIRLPMAIASHDHEPTPTPITANDMPVSRPHHLRGKQILLVEDNAINQRVMAKILENAGLDVAIAADGEQALGHLRQTTVDLVVMDVQMPIMDGLTCTQQIRADSRWSGLPILGLTASASIDDRNECLQVGMNAYCSKPVRAVDLVAEIERLLNPDGTLPAAAG